MTDPTGNKKGRPKGYSPGLRRVITHRVGAWSWNTETLHKRQQKGKPDECWTWLGSKTPHGNIFGAFKNDHAQMTQANRLLYMEQVNKPIDGLIVRMTCHNTYCCNPNHFEARPTDRKGPYKKKSMMLIQENLYIEGHNESAKLLTHRLKELFQQESFANGLDWNTQTLWAKLTPEQCTVFCLKYPEYADRFTKV